MLMEMLGENMKFPRKLANTVSERTSKFYAVFTGSIEDLNDSNAPIMIEGIPVKFNVDSEGVISIIKDNTQTLPPKTP